MNGDSVTDNEDIANVFNDYFINLSENLLSDIAEYKQTLDTPKCFMRSKLDSSSHFCIKPFNETTVFTMLTKLNVNKSAGVDCLGPRLHK